MPSFRAQATLPLPGRSVPFGRATAFFAFALLLPAMQAHLSAAEAPQAKSKPAAPATSPATKAMSPATNTPKLRHPTAKEVFDDKQTILFADDFKSGEFAKSPASLKRRLAQRADGRAASNEVETGYRWRFSENADYQIVRENPDRIKILDAPDLPGGRKAVRFAVARAPNSFRSEISLPHEAGFHERWYGERIYIPKDWVCDPNHGVDIVMQWHAIPGNGKPTNPNLEISLHNTQWHVRQTYGDPHGEKTRWQKDLDEAVRPGAWVAWVVHVNWSPKDDGLVQIWKDGKLVVERRGPNVYSTIGVEYTPYFKTGIYRPAWRLDKDGGRTTFDKDRPVTDKKVIYVTDVKIGGERAKYADVAPTP